MKTRPRVPRASRFLCIMFAEMIAVTYTAPPVCAQAPEPKQLTISILEGEGAINNIKQRTAREAIVQVQDENHKPVAGVAVTFFLAEHGASGVFANGSRSMTVLTDTNGQAAMRGMTPDKVALSKARRFPSSPAARPSSSYRAFSSRACMGVRP